MTVTWVNEPAKTYYFNTTDLIGGDHFAGSSAFIGARAVNLDTGTNYIITGGGILVAFTPPVALVAGSTSIGKVAIDQTTPYVTNLVATTPLRNLTVQPKTNPVLSVAATYVTGDYVGTSSACQTFSGCAAQAGAGGYVLGATLIDGAKQSIAGELWIFDGIPTLPLDSAAFTVSDADAAKVVCVLPFSTYYASAVNSISMAQPGGGPARFVCGAAVQELYGAFVTRGSPVYASLDLTFKLSIVQD